MNVDVLHCTWLPSAQGVFFWGETAVVARRTGRQPKRALHPFQSTSTTLREQLNTPGGVPAAPLAEHTETLWLPSLHMPIPSPELLATGTVVPPDGAPVLRPWQVSGVLVPLAHALDLLLALPSSRTTGADVQVWRMAALLALQVVAAQQVLPVLQRDGFHLRAAWRPRPDPPTSHTIAMVAQSLPPVCCAAVPDPSDAPSPHALLDNFLGAAVDGVIRAMPVTLTAEATTPGGAWLRALLGPDSIVQLNSGAADALYTHWQAWARQTQIAGDDVFRVTFRLDPPVHDNDPWTLQFLLQATNDPSLLVPAALVWRERGPLFTYLDRRFEQPQERLLGALGYAARIFPPLDRSLRHAAPEHAHLATSEAFTFLKEAAPLLEQSGFGVLVPAWYRERGARIQARARAKASSSQPNAHSRLSFNTLVSFDWELALAGQLVDRAEFERLVALKSPLVRVRGQWVVLDPDEMHKALAFFEQQGEDLAFADALRLALGGDEQGAPYGIDVERVDADGWLADLLAGLSDQQHLQLLSMPVGLLGELRPYQVRGFSWMAFLHQFGLGACLADDMGLGKTIQTIALLLHEREHSGVAAPALLVCPTSVIGNWMHELRRFAPDLHVLVHGGTERQQADAFKAAAAEHDVVLTSYPLLARDGLTLQAVAWSTVVLDEAQNIKNPSTKQAQAARAINAAHRIALTGTPVENRLSDLWSIMAFLNPDYLGSEATFRRDIARPIERTGDPHARDRLRRLTAPFVLRRLKTDPAIISDLPEKWEMKVYCSLTPEQATLYQAVVEEALEQIEQAETDGNVMERRGQVLAMLMKLKQICNHPAHFLKDGSTVNGRSGKLQRLQEMLEEVYATDDRTLIFTQFAEWGRMLQQQIQHTVFDDVLFLYGGTPAKERDALVRRFQAPNGPRVFILSLKAGGTGLNLTAANHVVHFDRWWNPAVENQATDRVFRIGQTRNVQVHKFICGGTLEEHIDDVIESKRALADSVLGTDEGWLTELSTAQLRDLVALRHADVVEV